MSKMKRVSSPRFVYRAAGVALVLLAVFVSGVASKIITVPDDVPTIQAGLDSAAAGDTVLVNPDTYYENLIWPDTPAIKLYANEEAPPESTIVDGSNTEAPVIRIETLVDYTTEIRCFVIQSGSGHRGGGISCLAASPTITSNLFLDNKVASHGGGVYCTSASPRILFNTFRGDSAWYGGAIASTGRSWPTIRGNTIDSCHADQGGGIYLSDAGHIVDNDITNCEGSGAAVHLVGIATADSNTVSSNHSTGFHCTGSCTLSNNDIAGNAGDGVYLTEGSTAHVSANSVSHNGIGINIEHASPVVEANTIAFNTTGISCCWGDGIQIRFNSISNGEIGVYT
jgi:parallel beta-helix repeat protein